MLLVQEWEFLLLARPYLYCCVSLASSFSDLRKSEEGEKEEIQNASIMVFDARLRNPSRFLLAGPSECGKTTWVQNLLRQADVLFEDPRCKQNIIYYYSIAQPSFEAFRKENIVTSWVNKVFIRLVFFLQAVSILFI